MDVMIVIYHQDDGMLLLLRRCINGDFPLQWPPDFLISLCLSRLYPADAESPDQIGKDYKT